MKNPIKDEYIDIILFYFTFLALLVCIWWRPLGHLCIGWKVLLTVGAFLLSLLVLFVHEYGTVDFYLRLLCKVGLHHWDGCVCRSCGKTRHGALIGCACSNCGELVHQWVSIPDAIYHQGYYYQCSICHICKHSWFSNRFTKCPICGEWNPYYRTPGARF
jgi:hypothetical protein